MGQTQSVKENISRAEKTGILQLSKSGIKEIPADMLKLRKNLRNLELSENKIDLLPSFVGEFQSLKQLSLAENRLSHLPDEICRLGKLETLSLSGNLISQLPLSFAQLTQLKVKSLFFFLFPMELSFQWYLDIATEQVQVHRDPRGCVPTTKVGTFGHEW